MLPYLIAGAIGFGIGKLFENGGETFMAGGQVEEQWNRYLQESRVDALVKAGYSKNVAKNLSSESWDSLEKQVQNAFKNVLISEEVEYMKSMMESIYTYGRLNKDNKYLAKYKVILGNELFNKTFDEYKKELEEGYDVVYGTYTDSEGVTYNSLRKKYDNGGGVGKYKMYKLRAEGLNDFINFLGTGVYFNIKSFTVEPIGVPDVVVSFETNLSLSEIKAKLREVKDSHVMLETIKPIKEYTGERYAGGGETYMAGGVGESDDKYGGQRNKIINELKGMKGGLNNKAPYVFVKEGYIYVSAENGDNYADYYEYTIDEKLEDLADRYNTYWDWETAGSIVLAPIDTYGGGGLPKKRRKSVSAQYGRSDTSIDKQLTAKPVGYRFTNAKANQLRKDPFAKPTEAQVKKYLGKGIYKENRKNRSDRDRNAKL